MNGTHDAGDVSSEEFNLSDNEADDAPDTGLGDYSAVFEEVMSDGEDEGGHANGDDEEEAQGSTHGPCDRSDTTCSGRHSLAIRAWCCCGR